MNFRFKENQIGGQLLSEIQRVQSQAPEFFFAKGDQLFEPEQIDFFRFSFFSRIKKRKMKKSLIVKFRFALTNKYKNMPNSIIV